MNNSLSFTDIQTAQRCLLKFKFRVVDRIQPRIRSVTMHEGSLQHQALQEAYIALQQGEDPYTAVFNWSESVIDARYLFDDELANQQDMVDVALTRTERYLDYWNDSWEVLYVEEQFILMLDDGTVLSCTPDLVVRDASGAVWIVDHKTYRTIPKEQNPDLQSMLSTMAVRALYPETAGFIYNYLRKKVPTQPQLVKAGTHVSRINDIDTTYEVLRNFLANEAPKLMDDPVHRRRLAELREDNRFFKRHTLYYSDEQLQEGLQDLSAQAKLMKYAYENEMFPRTMVSGGISGCERCGFRQICHAQLVQSDPERVLSEFYEPRDDSYKYYETEED